MKLQTIQAPVEDEILVRLLEYEPVPFLDIIGDREFIHGVGHR